MAAYGFYIDGVLFPVTPSKFNIKINNKNKTIILINDGEVNLLKSPGLSDIEVEKLILPLFQKYPFAMYENDEFQPANYYLDKLEKWKKSKKAHTLVLSRTSPNGNTLLFDTTMDVSIEDYEISEDAETDGQDICVKLSMKEWVKWGSKKLVIKNKKSKKSKKTGKTQKVAKVKKSRTETKTKKTYVIKKGDSLRRIAKKELGSETKWKEIYSLNQKTLDNEAKKHGHKSAMEGLTCHIYEKTKIKLPSK